MRFSIGFRKAGKFGTVKLEKAIRVELCENIRECMGRFVKGGDQGGAEFLLAG